jgi:accessory colonization factor AcfC
MTAIDEVIVRLTTGEKVRITVGPEGNWFQDGTREACGYTVPIAEALSALVAEREVRFSED